MIHEGTRPVEAHAGSKFESGCHLPVASSVLKCIIDEGRICDFAVVFVFREVGERLLPHLILGEDGLEVVGQAAAPFWDGGTGDYRLVGIVALVVYFPQGGGEFSEIHDPIAGKPVHLVNAVVVAYMQPDNLVTQNTRRIGRPLGIADGDMVGVQNRLEDIPGDGG